MDRPNVLQRGLHRLVMLRPVTAFLASRAHRIDSAVLRLTGGRYFLSEVLGWNVILLTTLGARTGQRRTVPLIGIFDRDRIALIASSFGDRHNPGWYYNLKAHPHCDVSYEGRSRRCRAREAHGSEYDSYWRQAVSLYGGYETYRRRAAHRHIPIMVLEPEG